jgi:cysteinyl-tRNA synthetase
MTRQKEEVTPSHPDGKIRMYECGMTPYSDPHIGHARTAITFDNLKRWLEFRGMPVIHVRNVTDIEDKIIKRANEQGISCADLVARFDAVRKDLFGRLNMQPPTFEPYATAVIPEIIAIVEKLVANGMAYAAGGDVYYRVRKFAGYGRLSKNSIEDLVSGARVQAGELKEDPLDFDLWKAAKPGEPSWDSPWGKGRPGWHIECSAMSMKYLGETLDIHGGANDLIFPHHENEAAQSEGATGKPFVRYWVHSGFVTMNQEKMSKSVGNVIGLREVVERVPGPALRLLMGQTHYRAPLEYSDAQERMARETWETLDRMLEFAPAPGGTGAVPEGALSALEAEVKSRLQAFDGAMDDDLSVPRALAEIFGAGREFQRVVSAAPSPDAASSARLAAVRKSLVDRLAVLGIEAGGGSAEAPAEVKALVAEREAARRSKEWKKADELRAAISALGWNIEDTPKGTAVRPK